MKQRVLKPRDHTEKINHSVVSLREVKRPEIKPDTFIEKLANDKFHYRNYQYSGGQSKFPHAPDMWVVDKFYPYAEGGPLAIDEANHLQDTNTLMLKKQILQESGIRYLCITYGMSELEVMEQLA